MADKRITELTNEKLILGDGDYTIVDSNEGTYKYKLKRIMDAIPAIDDSLSHEGEAADAKATGDEIADVKRDLNNKANIDGTYDGMTVGSSRQLLSEKYLLDEEPYLFRASGGDGADRVEECLVGGSVGWNQLLKAISVLGPSDWGVYNTAYGNISYANGELTYTFTQVSADPWPNGIKSSSFIKHKGHKLFVAYDIYVPKACNINKSYFQGNVYGPASVGWNRSETIQATNDSSDGEEVYCIFGITNPQASGYEVGDTYKIKNAMLMDLTVLFGSTIADYIYSLEQATAGAGVAWFRKYFPEDYYPYSAPTLRHVEGVSAKQIRDSDDNVTAIYPLDSSLTLRGVPKLTDGKMCFDGDKYNADGTVERNTVLRAYQSGDESLANAITDGTNTVVYSANASTEEATPYTALQTLDPNGTEEFVSTGIVPVGHYSKYLENLRSKIEGLPKDFSTLIAPTEKEYKATRNYTVGSLLIVDNILYKVTSAIANGGTITPNTNVTATTLAAVIAAL